MSLIRKNLIHIWFNEILYKSFLNIDFSLIIIRSNSLTCNMEFVDSNQFIFYFYIFMEISQFYFIIVFNLLSSTNSKRIQENLILPKIPIITKHVSKFWFGPSRQDFFINSKYTADPRLYKNFLKSWRIYIKLGV